LAAGAISSGPLIAAVCNTIGRWSLATLIQRSLNHIEAS